MRKLATVTLCMILTACGGLGGGGGSGDRDDKDENDEDGNDEDGNGEDGKADKPATGASSLEPLGVRLATPDGFTVAKATAVSLAFTKADSEDRFFVVYDFTADAETLAAKAEKPLDIDENTRFTPQGATRRGKNDAVVHDFTGSIKGKEATATLAGLARPTGDDGVGGVILVAVGPKSSKAALAKMIDAALASLELGAMRENDDARGRLDGNRFVYENVYHSGTPSTGTVSSSAREIISFCKQRYRWRNEGFTSADVPGGSASGIDPGSSSTGRWWIFGTGDDTILVGRDEASGRVTALPISMAGGSGFYNGKRAFIKDGGGC